MSNHSLDRGVSIHWRGGGIARCMLKEEGMEISDTTCHGDFRGSRERTCESR